MVGPKGMIFNDQDFSPYLKANPIRPILPPIDVTTDDVPGAPGRRFRDVRLEPLEIPVKVRMRAAAREDMVTFRRMLAAMLYTPEPAPLTLGDDPTRFYMATLKGSTELSSLLNTGSATLTFLASDPIAYGAIHVERLSGPVYFGGTWPTRPTIEARPGACSSFRVTLGSTGEYVEVRENIKAGDLVTVCCDRRECRINGQLANDRVTIESDYFEALGQEEIIISSGTAELSWYEMWL